MTKGKFGVLAFSRASESKGVKEIQKVFLCVCVCYGVCDSRGKKHRLNPDNS